MKVQNVLFALHILQRLQRAQSYHNVFELTSQIDARDYVSSRRS